jgi:hypothetical protein
MDYVGDTADCWVVRRWRDDTRHSPFPLLPLDQLLAAVADCCS